jgi:hypothetical protein
MQYMLLIYGDESSWTALPEDDMQAMYSEYFALAFDLRAQGKLAGSGELQPVATATTIRVSDGDTLVTDGPFAETKETLGGYFLIEAESLDEAIEWAARIPTARRGLIEIRPVVDHSGDSS